MSIKLGINGKKLCGPNFSIFYNDNYTSLTFCINNKNHRDYSSAHDDFVNNFVNFWYKNKTFFFETKENVYMFDLGDDTFKIPLNTKIGISMTNLDKNDKPISDKVKNIYIKLHNY